MGISISGGITVGPDFGIKISGGGDPPSGDSLLLETGDFLLLENGFQLLLE